MSTVIEFYPTPYGHDDLNVHAQAWENMHKVIDSLQKTCSVKAMYTAVSEPGCFFEAESDDAHTLKQELESHPLVQSVEFGTATLEHLHQSYDHALRVHLPLPEPRSRRRRW